MRRFSRRSVPALLLAVLLSSMAAPLAAAPAAVGGSIQVRLGSLVERILDTVVELLAPETPWYEKSDVPSPTAETADEGPTGQAQLGGSIDPNG